MCRVAASVFYGLKNFVLTSTTSAENNRLTPCCYANKKPSFRWYTARCVWFIYEDAASSCFLCIPTAWIHSRSL